MACAVCGEGYVNVGCMNRAGNADAKGTCRPRQYTVRTPLCDEAGSGHGLGGYTFLGLFGVSQNDASFQCRRRCDNEQNKLSKEAYPDPETLLELRSRFPEVGGIARTFDGGHCSGPHACDVANCNIAGSADDSQTDYQPKWACPVHIGPALAAAFWAALDGGVVSSAVATVHAMRSTKCQTCAACGQDPTGVADWGRGCARDCTQLVCATGYIFDWTEPVQAAKCKQCGELDDTRLCLSSEQRLFDGYDVSGWLPKLFMQGCAPKRQRNPRGYELSYGSCVKCPDFTDACVAHDSYYHTCEQRGSGVASVCRPCSYANGRHPTTSTYWDGDASRNLYCQQQPCAVLAGVGYTGIHTASAPHRMCHSPCRARTCDGGAATVVLPCVLPHQPRCKDAVNMDGAVQDATYRPVAYTPAHANVLEPNTTDLHLFASFENTLVDTDASALAQRAQCVWNAEHIPDNSANPGGVSAHFAPACRPWARDARAQYPLLPLQNTVVSPETADAFPRRLLLNTSARAVAYAAGSVERPAGVLAGDIYLELDLTNAHNATLAVFVPDDRRIEAAKWVPRWRASVRSRQLVGDAASVAVRVDVEATCLACFSLQVYV